MIIEGFKEWAPYRYAETRQWPVTASLSANRCEKLRWCDGCETVCLVAPEVGLVEREWLGERMRQHERNGSCIMYLYAFDVVFLNKAFPDLIRWEKKPENYLAMLHLALAWIAINCPGLLLG